MVIVTRIGIDHEWIELGLVGIIGCLGAAYLVSWQDQCLKAKLLKLSSQLADQEQALFQQNTAFLQQLTAHYRAMLTERDACIEELKQSTQWAYKLG